MVMPNQDHDCSCRRSSNDRVSRGRDLLTASGPLHRIAHVRQQQGVSLRAARQGLLLSSDDVRRQENENYDLLLSELYRWQKLLDVPVAELLNEPMMQLSQPVLARAALVKVMKTAVTILESATDPCMHTLAERLIDQLLDVMPELAGISGWPSVGQRRTLDELGRIAEQPYSIAPVDDY